MTYTRNKKGQFLKGQIPHNKGKKSPWAKNLPQLFKKGRKVSDEGRKIMSMIAKKNGFGLWMKGRKNPNHSLKMAGRKLSEETKKKISESLKKIGHKPPDNIGHKVSFETRRKISESRLGEKHWNWKGGVNDYTKLARKSLAYKLWRKSVFERDNYICQKCNIKGTILHPHHIKSFSKYKELRFDLDNGITFCEKCHKNFHKLYGKVDNYCKISEYIKKIEVLTEIPAPNPEEIK